MRKRRNINVALSTLRMIHNLSKDVDWDSDVEISNLIEIARLSKQGMEALTVEDPSPQTRVVGLDLTDDQRQQIVAVASHMDASPENVLKRAIGSYCAKFGGDGPVQEADTTNVVSLGSPVENQDSGEER